MKSPFNLVLLGDPASGKGTQAKILAKKYRLVDFDMGRELRKPSNRRRHNFSKTTGKGKLTPTWLVREILFRTIKTTPISRGILFDGTPKMIGEAKLVAAWLKQFGRRDPFVAYLAIPKSEIKKRIQGGRKYQRGRRIFRDDDAMQAMNNRLAYYRTQIARVVSFFKLRYPYKKISGMGTRKEVWKRLDGEIQKFLRKI